MTTRWPGSPSRSARQAGPAVAPSFASHAASSRLLDVDARVHDSVRFLHGGFSCRHQPSKSVLRIGRFPAPLQDDTTGQLSTRSRRTPRPFSYMMPRPACTMALPWSAARRYRADSAAHQPWRLSRPTTVRSGSPGCWPRRDVGAGSPSQLPGRPVGGKSAGHTHEDELAYPDGAAGAHRLFTLTVINRVIGCLTAYR